MADHFGNISISPAGPAQPKKKTTRTQPAKKAARKAPPPRRPRNTSALIIALVAIALLLTIYFFTGFWGVPKFLSSWLPAKVRNSVGMELSLQEVRFNPFTFRLELAETSLTPMGSEGKPILSFSNLNARFAPLSLLRGDFVTTSLTISQLSAEAVRNADNSYNFSPIIQSLRKSNRADFMDFSELPFLFSLNNISIIDSSMLFVDTPGEKRHTIEQIELTLPNLSNFPYKTRQYIQPGFSAVINGSPIKLSSQTAFTGDKADSDEQKTELIWNVNNIDLPLYFGYLPSQLPFTIDEGKADGAVKLSFTSGSQDEKILVEFALEIKELKLADINKTFRLQVPFSKFEGTVHPVTGNTHMKHILLQEPAFESQPGKLLELSRLLSFHQKQEVASTAQKLPELAIEMLIADNGTFSQTGKGKNKHINQWEAIQFNIKNYSTAQNSEDGKEDSVFRLRAEQSSSHTTLHWHGTITPDNLPSGSFRLDSIATGRLFDWFGVDSLSSTKGTADLDGVLTFTKNEKADDPPALTLSDGTLILHDLSLQENGQNWYSAPLTKSTGFSVTKGIVNLGKIELKNSAITLDTEKLPAIFATVLEQKSGIRFTALDYSGAFELKNSAAKRPPLAFDNLNLRFVYPSTNNNNEEDQDNLTFKAQASGKGEIQARGKITFAPFSSILTTAFTNLDATRLLPWFGNASLLTQTSGQLSGEGTFIYPEVSFNGQLEIAGGAFWRQKTTLLRWKNLILHDVRSNRNPFYFGGSEATFQGAEFSLERTASTVHPAHGLVTFLTEQFPQATEKQKKGVNFSSLELQKLTVKDGTIHYRENRLSPPWTAEITYFRGSLDNITAKASGGSSSPFSFSGNLDTVPFSLEGNINLFDRTARGDSLFNMKGYPFPSFNAQLDKQIDLDTRTGTFSLTTRSDWNEGQLNENSQILFENVRPTSDEADVALALALMTGDEKKFEILVSRKQPFTQPFEPLFLATLTSLQKTMVKAAVSPYLVATGDFGDIANNEYAEFLPGQIVLSGAGRESLTRYSSLLSTHPNLGLVVTGAADTSVDTAALHEQLEQAEMERVAIENSRLKSEYEVALAAHQERLEEAAAQQGPGGQIVEQELPPELLKPFTPITPEPVIIDNDMLVNLAKKRAQVIVDFFINRLALDPERITISDQAVVIDDMVNGGSKVLFTLRAYTPKTNGAEVIEDEQEEPKG